MTNNVIQLDPTKRKTDTEIFAEEVSKKPAFKTNIEELQFHLTELWKRQQVDSFAYIFLKKQIAALGVSHAAKN